MAASRPSRKKLMLMEQFISILLIFRNHLTSVNIYVYYAILVGFFAGKFVRQGNTAGSLLQYVSFFILLSADIMDETILSHIGVMIAVLNYIFIRPTVYTLPQYSPKVGLRENYSKRNNKQLYWAQWFPISQSEVSQQYQIPWNHTVQLKKMAQYMKIKGKIMFQAFKFIISHVLKYRLKFAKGSPAQYKGIIAFSHGRTGTPFIYSSLLQSFAREWKIITPQHSQVSVTPYTEIDKIKRYRQVEVKQRGDQIAYLLSKVGQNQHLVLMGHSYGCSTVLQAYHTLQLSVRKRVSHIVLLDPWLFPLNDEAFQDQIVCPVLILANQHFLSNKDVYQRNLRFIKRHKSKILYICWKGGDHLHQTDMGFVVGSSLRRIKNSKQCGAMIQKNIQAIQMFLSFQKLGLSETEKFQQQFKQEDLGIQFRPQKFSNYLNF